MVWRSCGIDALHFRKRIYNNIENILFKKIILLLIVVKEIFADDRKNIPHKRIKQLIFLLIGQTPGSRTWGTSSLDGGGNCRFRRAGKILLSINRQKRRSDNHSFRLRRIGMARSSLLGLLFDRIEFIAIAFIVWVWIFLAALNNSSINHLIEAVKAIITSVYIKHK